MKIKAIIAISAVCLVAQQGEAINFGKIIGTVGKTVSGVSKIVNGFLNIYRDDPIVCQESNFKAKVVATNALCQLQDDLEAMQMCQNFGSDCVAIPGRWGCGHFDGDNERGCMFRPSRAPGNRKLPKIIFDDETEDEAEIATLRANDQFPFARFGRHTQVSDIETLGDGDDVDYRDASHYYATTLTHDVNRYAEIFEENDSVQKNPVLALTAIVKALDLAGIRYPVGKSVCQVCKGICNKIMSGENVNTCKYSACVGFLGGYKGSESNPSCDLIPLP